MVQNKNCMKSSVVFQMSFGQKKGGDLVCGICCSVYCYSCPVQILPVSAFVALKTNQTTELKSSGVVCWNPSAKDIF